MGNCKDKSFVGEMNTNKGKNYIIKSSRFVGEEHQQRRKDLLNIIAKRMEVAKEIGQYKRDNNITILQSSRWQDLVKDRVKEGDKKGLSEEFLSTYLQSIHGESIRIQNEVMNNVTV